MVLLLLLVRCGVCCVLVATGPSGSRTSPRASTPKRSARAPRARSPVRGAAERARAPPRQTVPPSRRTARARLGRRRRRREEEGRREEGARTREEETKKRRRAQEEDARRDAAQRRRRERGTVAPPRDVGVRAWGTRRAKPRRSRGAVRTLASLSLSPSACFQLPRWPLRTRALLDGSHDYPPPPMLCPRRLGRRHAGGRSSSTYSFPASFPMRLGTLGELFRDPVLTLDDGHRRVARQPGALSLRRVAN